MTPDGLKLICPICEVEFITNHSQKIYCNERCREKRRKIEEHINANKLKQEMFKDGRLYYDLNEDGFYINAWRNENLTKNNQ